MQSKNESCIGLAGDRVWLEDSATGENLLTNLQAQRALRAEKEARQAAEVRAMAEAAARQAAEAHIAELEAKLQLRQQQQTPK